MDDIAGLDANGARRWDSRASEAYHRIRALIYDGSIPPDATLVEARLVRVLEMSRTPVREALHRMEAEGLLEALPRGGYAVVTLSSEDVNDLYQIRAVLEGLAAETAAARSTRVAIAQLEDLYDEMDVAVQRRDDKTLIRLNRQFHRAVAAASGNRHLERMLDDIKGAFERFRTDAVADDERRRTAHAEHQALIEALKARDGARARRVAEEHVHHALSQGTRAADG
ncbi:GntR family transcriptional regulator [Nocardioides sp. zg-ZUI104]|uniref:GntR family transcriptional regulator n=1 Tax=Nocardioides faecalis TaxID=2803858 RepID=UPI001BCEB382|nr:GntR family transcriptional regulator [Nocardioides faecalis]MBS4751262.1 GntR family transcriptional regulator [Nocardioides faecalis]